MTRKQADLWAADFRLFMKIYRTILQECDENIPKYPSEEMHKAWLCHERFNYVKLGILEEPDEVA